MPPPTNRKINPKVTSVQKQNDEKIPTQPLSDGLSLLKHAHIPAIPNSNMVLFHLVALTFSLTATVMQYLHLYRTVWWLPQSHAKKALNFYLIDTHLVGYLVVMESVPFLYSIYKQVIMWESRRAWFIVSLTFTVLLWLIWIIAFLFFSLCVYKKTQGFYLLILFYPPIAYAIIYYHFIPFKLYLKSKVLLKSFFKSVLLLDNLDSNVDNLTFSTVNNPVLISNHVTNLNTNCCGGSLDSPSRKLVVNEQLSGSIPNTPGLSTTIVEKSQSFKQVHNSSNDLNRHSQNDFINPSPTQLALEQYGIFYYSKSVRHSSGFVYHNCSMNPEDIREEVEMLKANFNRTFRDIFFGTLFTFFYASLVPLLFVPRSEIHHATNATILNAIHYDGVWCGQHVFVTAITAFLLYSVQHLTPAYVDVLHRCALHLGRWRREEGRSANVPYNPWSQLQIFSQGALVKHVRGLFRAVGVFNSAEPGNNMHNRFFYFFYPALRLINVMCTLVILILLFQYILLIQNYEWYKLISVGSMMFFNVFSLYKILRNRFLLGRCYKEESLSNINANNSIATNNSGAAVNNNNTYHLHTD